MLISEDLPHVPKGRELSGNIMNLSGVEHWTSSDSSYLNVQDMDLDQEQEIKDRGFVEAERQTRMMRVIVMRKMSEQVIQFEENARRFFSEAVKFEELDQEHVYGDQKQGIKYIFRVPASIESINFGDIQCDFPHFLRQLQEDST